MQSARPTARRGTVLGIGLGVVGLGCCVGPAVAALLGITTATVAVDLATGLYEKWGWAFKFGRLPRNPGGPDHKTNQGGMLDEKAARGALHGSNRSLRSYDLRTAIRRHNLVRRTRLVAMTASLRSHLANC